MNTKPTPSVSAVVAAYQAEEFIADAVNSILAQTRPPDEVIVVDDGSTDGTAAELARFGDRIRVVRRANGGCPAAFNTAFRKARGDFVAMCGADDMWEPHKLEWQLEAIEAHPEVDVLFGDMVVFGDRDGLYNRPPGTGVLDSEEFKEALFRENMVGAPSIVIRRSLFERLGPFIENFGADDYEYWMRCLRDGARFYFDPRPLVRYRKHEGSLTNRLCWILECACEARRAYADDLQNPSLVTDQMSGDLFKIAHLRLGDGRRREARAAFRHCLRYASGAHTWRSAKSFAWMVLLSLPPELGAAGGQAARGLHRIAGTAPA